MIYAGGERDTSHPDTCHHQPFFHRENLNRHSNLKQIIYSDPPGIVQKCTGILMAEEYLNSALNAEFVAGIIQ
jgi:hypothetical protein